MTTGRNLYKKYERIINIAISIDSILPKSINKMLYNSFKCIEMSWGVWIRYILLKNIINKMGKSVYIGPHVTIKNPENLSIGDNVSIHCYTYIDASGKITIGNNVSIAHNCSLISFEHTYNEPTLPIKYNPCKHSPIQIEDDAWLGCGVRILAGVTIYNRSICAAGCVVTKSFTNNVILGGIPAKIIKTI